MIVVSGIRTPLGEKEGQAASAACHKLGLKECDVASFRMRKLSYDARHGKITQVCSIVLELKNSATENKLCAEHSGVKPYLKTKLEPVCGKQILENRPVVVGFGPAGMFAAYLLSVYGYSPIVLERGGAIKDRKKAVGSFFASGNLDDENNIQFGEGGAGTFSDGKLTTRINDPLCDFVLEIFNKFGAPDDILYKAKPHVGSDKLQDIVRNIRKTIVDNGGRIIFHSRVDDIAAKNGVVDAVKCDDMEYKTAAAVVACGHSARDTFAMLCKKGLILSAKPFSVGVRIEHQQIDIDAALYGSFANDPRLPKGEYALSADINGRGVYTFCMCPGGTVVAAASEQGGVVTNGMSEYARGGKNANSALVASVGFNNPFVGIEFQRKLERLAFDAAGGGYKAPAQDLSGFLAGKPTLNIKRVTPSYPLGIKTTDISVLLGSDIANCLRAGIGAFAKKLRGFDAPDAILTGLETRTSSPLRIERDAETRQALGMAGLYPCGEGAGYAGGIMSAAVDGLKSAVAIIEKYAPIQRDC